MADLITSLNAWLFGLGGAFVAFACAQELLQYSLSEKLKKQAQTRPNELQLDSDPISVLKPVNSRLELHLYLQSLSSRFRDVQEFGKSQILIAMTASVFVFSLLLFSFATQSLFLAFFVSIAITGAAGLFLLQYFENERRLLISKHLPQAFDGLIRCLRSGFDLNRSILIVSDETIPLLRSEFRRALRERDFGQSLDEAIRHMSIRLKSADLAFFATLISVQERSGGPLVYALDSLSQILKDRERLRQKRMSASAESRMSAAILGGLPILVAAALLAFNPAYRETLFYTQSGRLLLVVALALLGIGSFVMYRLVKSET